jgi:hypothetical protein
MSALRSLHPRSLRTFTKATSILRGFTTTAGRNDYYPVPTPFVTENIAGGWQTCELPLTEEATGFRIWRVMGQQEVIGGAAEMGREIEGIEAARRRRGCGSSTPLSLLACSSPGRLLPDLQRSTSKALQPPHTPSPPYCHRLLTPLSSRYLFPSPPRAHRLPQRPRSRRTFRQHRSATPLPRRRKPR